MTHLDTVWMVTLPDDKGVVYEIGATANEVWGKIIANEILGTGHTYESLIKLGYRARRINLSTTPPITRDEFIELWQGYLDNTDVCPNKTAHHIGKCELYALTDAIFGPSNKFTELATALTTLLGRHVTPEEARKLKGPKP